MNDVPVIQGEASARYQCAHCESVSLVITLQPTEKATLPEVEFCPYCGMSNEYARELAES